MYNKYVEKIEKKINKYSNKSEKNKTKLHFFKYGL